MTLDSLRCLCAVIEAGSFRGAAARAHRSQPAVSQQIRNLEEELGGTLVVRKTGVATPRGHLLYERARNLLNDAESLVRALEDFDEDVARVLRVGTSDTTAIYFLPPYVRAFSEAMPRTHLELLNRSTAELAEALLRGELDLGIVTLPVAHEDLEELTLFSERFVLVLPRAHRLASHRQVALSALAEESFLLLDESTRTGALLADFFKHEDFRPRATLHSGSFEVIKRYVAEGVGVAFLPEAVVAEEEAGLARVRVPKLPQVHIGAIWRRGAYRSRAEQIFLDLITGTPTRVGPS